MSKRTEALSVRLEEGARALAALARTLTEAEWQTPTMDGRKIGVVVHHVGNMYPLEIQLALTLAKGEAIAGVTWDDVHAVNARHAKDFERVTKEEAVLRVTPEHVQEMAVIQASILAAGGAALRGGGVLVYSTCTISPTENERQIERFLDRNSDFELDDLTHGQTIHTHPRADKLMLTMPHRERTAGFFVARMRRITSWPSWTPRSHRTSTRFE